MTWDFGEVNPFSNSGGNFTQNVSFVVKCLERFGGDAAGFASQADASTQSISTAKVVSTDPPYYDNISYADLSDFFYIWMRRSLKTVFPDLFATLAVPKSEELVASPYRHGSQHTAETFFLSGMTQAMHRLSERAHPGFPLPSITHSSSLRPPQRKEQPARAGKHFSTPSSAPDCRSLELGQSELSAARGRLALGRTRWHPASYWSAEDGRTMLR